MQFHRFRTTKLLAGSLMALGALAVPVSAMAAPAHGTISAPATVTVPAAETSSFVAFSGTSFTGTARDINGCGVHNMPFAVKSYHWIARGQSGRMYNVANAAGAAVFVFNSGESGSSSTPVGWKSIDIIC
jgi:MiAMP1